MTLAIDILVLILIAIGTLFSVIGVLGMIRLPDVYTCLHATGKVSVFGVVFLVLAAAFNGACPPGPAIVLILFLVVAGPVLSHALTAAAWKLRIPPAGIEHNDMPEEK